MDPVQIAKTQVKIKNLPKTFSVKDKTEFLYYFGAKHVVIGKDFCIAQFASEDQATCFLQNLHQKELEGSRLKVEYYTKNYRDIRSEQKHTDDLIEKSPNRINEFFQKLIAINPTLNFNAPPPPQLRYRYPKATPEIIQSISKTLETVPKFYTQVLHLMNKMNLPPPFTPTQTIEKTFINASCQTDVSNVKGRVKHWKDDLQSGESELESDEDTKKPGITPKLVKPIKRKNAVPDMTDLSKRLKPFVNEPKLEKPKNKCKDQGAPFELVKTGPKKITLQIPQELNPKESASTEQEATDLVKAEKITAAEEQTAIDLTSNKLTNEQMLLLPVFKNYQPGEKSNKLYIKNLAKTVNEDDLKRIYCQFVKKSASEIDVKLMQSGRMKGQAFVTFSTPYDEEDLEANQDRMIDKAIKETNGYILKEKPMVVMYGKNSKT